MQSVATPSEQTTVHQDKDKQIAVQIRDFGQGTISGYRPSTERPSAHNTQPNHHDHSPLLLFADRKVPSYSRILSICASKLPFVAVCIPVTVLIFFPNGSRHRTLRSALTRHYSASTSTHTSCASTSHTLCLKTMRHRRCMTRAPDI